MTKLSKKVKKYEDGSAGLEASGQMSFSDKFKQKLSDSKLFNSTISLGTSILGSMPTPNADLNANNQSMAEMRGSINQQLISSGDPYMMMAGAASMLIDKTGGFSESQIPSFIRSCAFPVQTSVPWESPDI